MNLAINGRFLSQHTTGVQRMAREFTRALDRLLSAGSYPNLSVRLLVQSGTDLSDLNLSAIHVETVPGYRGHVWEQFALPRHIGNAWLLNLGNTAPLLSLMAPAPVAVVVHDISYRIFPKAYRLHYRLMHRALDKVLMRRSRVIFTVAETERAVISHYYPEAAGRIFVVQNGGWRDDALAPTSNASSTNAERYGLYVGSFSARKNIETVIASAVALARARGLRFKLAGRSSPILAGVQLSIPSDVKHLIEFCGQIESLPELEQLYRGAAFILFPSLYEASALPPMEAMAQGCPLILSDIPSLRERCADAAVYCDPLDVDQIRAAAEHILDDPEFSASLVARGISLARQCSWQAQARAIIDTLQAFAA